MTDPANFIRAGASTAGIDAGLNAVRDSAPHLFPVMLAVRDRRVGLLAVPQGKDAFPFPPDRRRRAIVIVGDDLDVSYGPHGFHMPSIRRLIRACRAFAVVSGAATRDVYGALATAAVLGQHALIIETRLEHEFDWVELIQKLAPRRPLIVSTVKGGTA